MSNVQHSSVTFEWPLNVLSRGLKKHEQKELNILTSPREGDRQRRLLLVSEFNTRDTYPGDSGQLW